MFSYNSHLVTFFLHVLQNSFNAQQRNAKDHDPHTVAGCLKRYLRELPEPLLTYDLYPEFMSAVQ